VAPLVVANLEALIGFRVNDDGAKRWQSILHRSREEGKRGAVAVLDTKPDLKGFDIYERKLKESQRRAELKGAYQAKLGVDFDARAFTAAERETNRLSRATKQHSHEVDDNVRAYGRLNTAFGRIYGAGGTALLAAGGIYGIRTAVESVTAAYGRSQASQTRLQAQLRASGISYAAHKDHIDAVIQSTSKLTALDDEDLQDAFTAIVRVTGDVNKSLRDVALASDLARAKHMDVTAAANLLAKAESGNVGALRRYGVAIKPVTTAQDALAKSHDTVTTAQRRQAVEQDKQATAQRIIAAAQRQFAGQAEAYGRTQQGAVERLQVAWENLQEQLGQKLAPTFTHLANVAAKFISQVQDGTGAGGEFARDVGKIFDVVKTGAGILRSNIRLIKDAAAAWLLYTGYAKAAAGVTKLAGLQLAGGRIVAGGVAAGAAGTAARGAGIGAAEAAGGGAAAATGIRLLSATGLRTVGLALARRIPVLAAALAVVDVVTSRGNAGQRLQSAASSLTFGAVPRPQVRPNFQRDLATRFQNRLAERAATDPQEIEKVGQALDIQNGKVAATRAEWAKYRAILDDAAGGQLKNWRQIRTVTAAFAPYANGIKSITARIRQLQDIKIGNFLGNLGRNFRFFTPGSLTKSFTDELKKLPQAARAHAESTMIEWARTMERQGRLPRGAAARIVKDILKNVGSLPEGMQRLTKKGVDSAAAQLRRRDMVQAARRQERDLERTYQDFPKVAKTTGANARLNFLVELEFLRRKAKQSTGALHDQAEADLHAVQQAAKKWGHGANTSLNQELKAMGIQGGRKADDARDVISRALRQMATHVGGSSANAAIAVADAMTSIHKNANAVLRAFGAKTVDINTAAYRQSGINQMTAVTGHAATGGLLDRATGTVKRATGGIPHPGSGGRDDHLLLDPNGRPVAAMSGTEGILNRPQMGIVEGALGFAKQFGGLAFGSLSELWQSGMRHYAGGGLLQRMNQLERMKLPYVWGGHHGERGPIRNPRPGLDCSSTISYVLGIPPRVSGAFENYGQPGPGAISIFANPVHVFMRAFGKWFGTSNSNPGGGPGFIAPRSTAGFVARHVDPNAVGGDITVRQPRITGPPGALLSAARGAARAGTRAANQYINRQLAASDNPAGQPLREGAAGAGADVVTAFRRAASALRANPTERLALFEAGIVESGLRNLHRGDADSLGALQERASIFGRAHALNPFASASRFLRDAESRRPWHGSAGMLAAAVQRPRADLRGRYDQVAGQARRYLGRGGRLQRFATGGRLGTTGLRPLGSAPIPRGQTGLVPLATTPTQVTFLRGIRGKQIASYNKIEGDHGTLAYLQKDHDLAERHFNEIDEGTLVDAATGAVNTKAVASKAKWAQRMYDIEVHIRKETEKARLIAQRVIETYRTIVQRWKRAVRHARKGTRANMLKELRGAQAGLAEWQNTARDLGYDVANAKLDASDAFGQWQSILGTRAGDAAAGTAGQGLTADQQALVDQATQLRQIVDTGTFLNASAQGVFGGVTGPGGGPFGGGFNPSAIGQATVPGAGGMMGTVGAGGGAAGGAAGGGTVVNIHFSSLVPASPQQAQEVAGHVVSGLGYQGSVRSANVDLGI
jgi:hypothetical protein